jgi:ribonuclease P protein component
MVFARAWPPRAAVKYWPAAAPKAASGCARNVPRGTSLTTPESRNKLTFEPCKRLHLPAEFSAVRQRGKRVSDAFFSLTVLPNKERVARLGLAISTRSLGTAVARNRIKRITRESFRLNQHRLPPMDITVSARDTVRSADAKDLRESLEKHWRKIAERF